MPQTTDKWKLLVADLGRPTLRGIRKCPKCLTINGTRGNSCKNKSCDVVFRDMGMKKKAFTEACKLCTPQHLSNYQVFSVRRRDKGPDYRNFVSIPLHTSSSSSQSSNEVQPNEIPISGNSDGSLVSSQKCFVDACNVRGKPFPCQHLQSVQKCFANSQVLSIKESVLSTLTIPAEHKEVIAHYLNSEIADKFVQRVSSTSFVVRCDVSPKFPLGLLHVMIYKPNKYEGLDKRFFCSCRPYKLPAQNRNSDLLTNNGHTGNENKYCVHYYTCLCAIASCQSLSSEFDYLLAPFTSESREFSSSLLSELHLVNLPSTNNNGRDIEILDPNQISVEIMREDMSLLDSIDDDSSLANVQELEGVLEDQIIVTNDDGFSLDTNSELDDLSEAERQVCQMFVNAQNMNLQNAFTSSSPVTVNSLERNSPSKKRKPEEDFDKGSEETGSCFKERSESTSICIPSSSLSTTNYEKPMNKKTEPLHSSSLPKTQQNIDSSSSTNSDNRSTNTDNSGPFIISISTSQPPVTNITEKKLPSIMFEQWLAGVNERINSLMNFKLSGTPEPIVLICPMEFFDCLKDRIGNTGLKKRRLPNQTSQVVRDDSTSKKSLTKYMWKITCLNHLLQIFSCEIVPLKPTQYFIKTGNDSYEEWIEPKCTDSSSGGIKNNLPTLAPILHSTTLKIGKPEYSSLQQKELSGFTIEYIPDFLPVSKMGELTLKFEFEFEHSKVCSNVKQ